MQPRTTLPPQPFFALPGQRIGLARERFFEEGQRPTGLVSEPVIQSWARCVGARRSPREAIAFDPVTRSRLQAALERNERLLDAAGDEIARLEGALAGSGCRVLLTDAEGVIVHATPLPALPAEPVLKRLSRVGVNLAEGVVGTNAPAVVVKTRAPVTVFGAEHYFDCVQTLSCAAAPIRDGQGCVAGVLDLTVEARPFGFDAAALVGLYATTIENRLLAASAGEQLLLQLQVCSTLLGTPLQALLGVDGQGRVAWLNGTAQQLLGGGAGELAETLFGATLAELLARSGEREPRPLRLPNGLTVWLRSALKSAAGLAGAAPAPMAADAGATLNQHTREVIERTLQQNGGNISRAARALGVSRGLLYRRLKDGGRAA